MRNERVGTAEFYHSMYKREVTQLRKRDEHAKVIGTEEAGRRLVADT